MSQTQNCLWEDNRFTHTWLFVGRKNMLQTQDCLWEDKICLKQNCSSLNNRCHKHKTAYLKIKDVKNTGLFMVRLMMSQTKNCLLENNICHKHKAAYMNIMDVTTQGCLAEDNRCIKHKTVCRKSKYVTNTVMSIRIH